MRSYKKQSSSTPQPLFHKTLKSQYKKEELVKTLFYNPKPPGSVAPIVFVLRLTLLLQHPGLSLPHS